MKYIRISRPRFWIYVLWPLILGMAIGFDGSIYRLMFYVSLFFTFPANFLVYGINDIFDHETDMLNIKKSWYEAVLDQKYRSDVLIIIIAIAIIWLVYTWFLGRDIFAAYCVWLVASIEYSAPVLRAKTIPIIDTIVSALIYVVPGIIWYMLMWGGQISWWLVLWGIAWSMAMHAYSAVPDISADTSAGISTVATYFGARDTLIVCSILYGLAALSLSAYPILAVLIVWVYGTMMWLTLYTRQYLYYYRRFPLVNTCVGMLLTLRVLVQKFAL